MKLTPSFVLALVAASSASASPLLRRQDQSSSGGLPTPSAVLSSASSAASSAAATSSVSSSSSSSSSPTSSSSSSSAPSASSTSSASGGSSTSTTFNDTQILQYALTLEHLEATFYNESLSKLSTSDFENAGYNASVRDRIYSIGRDEASHVEFLTQALGNQSVPACTYNFSSVTDVESFLTTARVLEGVGVSAYLGAAGNITNKDYLSAAGSILVVEGQHQSYLIAQTNEGGNSIPSPYATPLDFKQVYSLAAPFIESCPSNASLPLTAFPTLTLGGGAANGSFTPGQQVTVSYNSTNSSGDAYLAVIQGVTGPQFVSLSGNNASVTLPSNLTGGQMYAVVTSDNTAVTDDNTLAGPAVGYVNVPLQAAPDASSGASSSSTAASSSSSASAGASSTGSAVAGGPTAAPTASSSDAQPTASGSDTIVSTDSAASSSSSATESISSSLASLGSANLPQPTTTN